MCQSLGIHKTQITPCRPSGSDQFERYNRTLIDAVHYYIDGCPKRWDQYLDPFAGALRSVINRHTGYPANKLMLGREVNVPVIILYRPPDSNDFQNTEKGEMEKYVHNLQENLKSHMGLPGKVKRHIKTMKRDYDIRTREHHLKVGDGVLAPERREKK